MQVFWQGPFRDGEEGKYRGRSEVGTTTIRMSEKNHTELYQVSTKNKTIYNAC